MERKCATCGEPWAIELEPDGTAAHLKVLLQQEYGEGFKIADEGMFAYILRCPCCPQGAMLGAHTEEAMAFLLD